MLKICRCRYLNRVVTKILSCQVNTTNSQGVKQLGISFGFTFLQVSYERDLGATFVVAGGNLRPPVLNDSCDKKPDNH